HYTPNPHPLSQGHFGAADIAATQALTPGPLVLTDHAPIFELLNSPLACRTLIHATSLASQEVKALDDPHSASYSSCPHPPTPPSAPPQQQQQQQHIAPWPLRVLAVRLQALGFGAPRRAVMSYYELAREARAQLGEAKARHDHSASEAWTDRLADLGVRVAG